MPLYKATIKKQAMEATHKLIGSSFACPAFLRGEIDGNYVLGVGKIVEQKINSKEFKMFYGEIIKKAFNGNVDAAIYDLIGGMLDEELKRNPQYKTTQLTMLKILETLGYPYKRKTSVKTIIEYIVSYSIFILIILFIMWIL